MRRVIIINDDMKGITPVVAIILLLMITIVVIGFATGFFQTLITTLGGSAVEQGEIAAEQLAKTVTIDLAGTSGADTMITVRASGSRAVPVSELSVFVDNIVKTCNFGATTEIAVGTAETCNITGETCASGLDVKVTAPGGEALSNCA